MAEIVPPQAPVEAILYQRYPNYWVLRRRGKHLIWSGQRSVAAGSEAACRAAARFLGYSIEWVMEILPGETEGRHDLSSDWEGDDDDTDDEETE